jgi:hypothetical protein
MANTNTPFWPAIANTSQVWIRAFLMAGMALVAITMHPLKWKTTWPRLVVAAVVTVAGLSFTRSASLYLAPHYSIKESSQDLTSLFSDCVNVRALRTEGIFNNNSLHYQSLKDDESPECVLVAFSAIDREAEFDAEYDLVKTYRIFVSPEFCKTGPASQSSDCSVHVRAYTRRRISEMPKPSDEFRGARLY